VAGLLVPEQREAVNQAATLIDLTEHVSDVDSAVWARARLVSFSRGERRRYAERSSRQVARLREALGENASLQGAVVEAALAIESNTRVAVVVGLDDLSEAERVQGESLADAMARSGVAVVLVTEAAERTPSEPELVGSTGSGMTHE
jgi:hypothetical protein